MSSRKVIVAVDIFKYKYNHNIRAKIEAITNNKVLYTKCKNTKDKSTVYNKMLKQL